MITVSPLTGYKYITPFTVTVSPSAEDIVINWGDLSFSDTSVASHVYSAEGIYSINAGTCNSTSAFTLSVFRGGFFDNKIRVSYQNLTATAACQNTFSLYVSSQTPSATIYFYSSGSNAYPSNDDSFWSHLNPQWRFLDVEGNPVSELTVEGKPVYDNNLNVLGYSALSSVSYIDDMPGNPVLFFTMVLEQCSVPINSRIYSALNYSVSADRPTRLLITSDGLNPINGIQWAGKDIPYVISVQGSRGCNTIMHYASGFVTGVKGNQLCNGVNNTQFAFPVSSINLYDNDCLSTGGYLRTNFNLPVSALPSNVYVNDKDEFACVTKSPDEIEYSLVRYAPYTTLSATATIRVNGVNYTLSGASDPFYIYRLENFHNFLRKGEHITPYDIIKKYSHFDLTTTPLFNSYLNAIAGSGDSLGKVYDKIVNISKDTADLDLCNIDFLYDIASKMDVEIDDYGLEFPEELKRLMNFFSMPLQKLIGTRCVCNTQFSCQACCGKNICSICGYDKKNNLGQQLTMSSYVTAGQTILIKESGSDIFEFLPITRTCMVRDITASPVYQNGIQNYCYFNWNNFHQSNPVEGVIDYLNPNTTLSKDLSSSRDWYKDNGVIEEMINYTLTKNVLNS
jgi:hypothetical protein